MPRADKTPPAVRDAAEGLIVSLLSQPELVAMVAEHEIQRQVNAGNLIPVSRLQMGPGLELAPRGRIAELEETIRQAIGFLGDAEFKAAFDLLSKVDAPTTRSAPAETPANMPESMPVAEALAGPEPKPGVRQEAEDEDKPNWLASRSQNGGGDGKPLPKEADGKPTDMPANGETRACEIEGCDVEVDDKQGQMSFARFRKVMCRAHFTEYKPQRAKAKAKA